MGNRDRTMNVQTMSQKAVKLSAYEVHWARPRVTCARSNPSHTLGKNACKLMLQKNDLIVEILILFLCASYEEYEEQHFVSV